jgi:hypothetical protein
MSYGITLNSIALIVLYMVPLQDALPHPQYIRTAYVPAGSVK